MQNSLSPDSLSPGWAATGGLAERFRAIPDELWKHRGLFLLMPSVLTAAWVVLVAEVGVHPPVVLSIFARICVFQVCMTLVAVLAYAFVPDRARWVGQRSRTALFAMHTLLVVVAVIGGGEVALALFRSVGIHDMPKRSLIYGLGLVFGFLAQALVVLFDGLELRAQQGELREERALRQAERARLDALQSRTNPHFLFNSLNAIAGLIAVDPKRAERAVESLSEVMRYALDSTRVASVPLSDEVEAVGSYLALEGLRYGERLRSRVEVPDALGGLRVPPLCLQPLVENAVLHGVARREPGGEVIVSAERRGEQLLLRVEDDGPGPGSSSHSGTGTALRDLRERLALLFADRAGLRVERGARGGCSVELRLPASGAGARP